MKNQMQCILEYIAIAFMVLNIVGYAVNKSISCIALFGAGTYIARCFSKNLTINIFAGLLVSNVFFGCSSLREGLFDIPSPVDFIEEKKKNLELAVQAKIDLERAKIVQGVANAQSGVTSKMNDAKQKIKDKAAAAQSGVTSKMNEAKQGVIETTGCRPNAKGEKWSLKYSTLQCAPHTNEKECIKNMPQGNPYCEWK